MAQATYTAVSTLRLGDSDDRPVGHAFADTKQTSPAHIEKNRDHAHFLLRMITTL